ncbi:MAG: hypothetical protein IKQ03_10425 [Prevotella sp.]|nr:hypothetical protein [Prevotella sp.]
MMTDFYVTLIALGCGCLLPIFGIWFGIREKMNETNQRTQILLAAIEKNPDMDVEELLEKMTPKKKLLKEKLLSKLQAGCITSLLGLAFIGYGSWICYMGGDNNPLVKIIIGLILLAVGIAFLINYFVGKRLLAKEIEAEEQNMSTQS